jgi:hypothetical protein
MKGRREAVLQYLCVYVLYCGIAVVLQCCSIIVIIAAAVYCVVAESGIQNGHLHISSCHLLQPGTSLRSLHKHPPARLNREASPHMLEPKRAHPQHATQRCRKPPLARQTDMASFSSHQSISPIARDHAAPLHTRIHAYLHTYGLLYTNTYAVGLHSHLSTHEPGSRDRASSSTLHPLHSTCQPSTPDHAIQPR